MADHDDNTIQDFDDLHASIMELTTDIGMPVSQKPKAEELYIGEEPYADDQHRDAMEWFMDDAIEDEMKEDGMDWLDQKPTQSQPSIVDISNTEEMDIGDPEQFFISEDATKDPIDWQKFREQGRIHAPVGLSLKAPHKPLHYLIGAGNCGSEFHDALESFDDEDDGLEYHDAIDFEEVLPWAKNAEQDEDIRKIASDYSNIDAMLRRIEELRDKGKTKQLERDIKNIPQCFLQNFSGDKRNPQDHTKVVASLVDLRQEQQQQLVGLFNEQGVVESLKRSSKNKA
jgi:hypothetical protein